MIALKYMIVVMFLLFLNGEAVKLSSKFCIYNYMFVLLPNLAREAFVAVGG